MNLLIKTLVLKFLWSSNVRYVSLVLPKIRCQNFDWKFCCCCTFPRFSPSWVKTLKLFISSSEWKVGVKNWVLTWSKKSGSQLMQMRIFANFAPSFPFKQKFPTGNCMQQTIFWFMSKSIIAFKKSTFKECKEAVDSSSRCKLLPKINFTSKLLFDYHHSIDVCAFFFNHFSWL